MVMVGVKGTFFTVLLKPPQGQCFSQRKYSPPFLGGRSMDVISNQDFYKILFVVERGRFPLGYFPPEAQTGL
jgi:hypothetical protein